MLLLVVGEPLEVEKVSNPTKEQVDKLHAIYIQRSSSTQLPL